MDWTNQDSTLAAAQGWNVYEALENNKFHPVIQRADNSTIFSTDEAAREFVKLRASASSNRCALAHKAYALVFKSKVGAFK